MIRYNIICPPVDIRVDDLSLLIGCWCSFRHKVSDSRGASIYPIVWGKIADYKSGCLIVKRDESEYTANVRAISDFIAYDNKAEYGRVFASYGETDETR